MRFFRPAVLLLLLTTGTTSARATAPQAVPLSEHFSARLEGKGGKARLDIVVHTAGGKEEYLGSVPVGGPPDLGLPNAGLKMDTLAVSKDGRSIVFRHSSRLAKSHSQQKSGIYRYELGKTLLLVHPSEELVQSWHAWSHPPPADVLVFQSRMAGGRTGPIMTLSAGGEERPLALLGASALHEAAYEGNTSAIDALLEKSTPLDALTWWGDTPLSMALMRFHDDAAVRLVEHGASLELGPNPPLHVAAFGVSLPVLDAMARRGVDVNALDGRKDTALHVALTGRSAEHLGYRDQVFEDDDRKRPWERMPESVHWLLEHGADPNARNGRGATALHLSLGWLWEATSADPRDSDAIDVARDLLAHGASPNLGDNDGDTPLHLLVAERRTCYAGEDGFTGHDDAWRHSNLYQMLALLVAGMKDVDARNAAGLTPLDLALRGQNFMSANYLLDHDAVARPAEAGDRGVTQVLEDQAREWEKSCGRKN